MILLCILCQTFFLFLYITHTHSFFRVPYEVVKQRLQVGAYPNTMVALQSIYQQVSATIEDDCVPRV